MRTVYLDNNATTRVDPKVVKAMLPFFTEQFGSGRGRHDGHLNEFTGFSNRGGSSSLGILGIFLRRRTRFRFAFFFGGGFLFNLFSHNF